MSKVRVRFAPSPTGFLNPGGARSALFNWLFAKQTKGQLILRLEDTDRQRFVPEAVEQLQDALKWLGLEWDEGIGVGGSHAPYVQSERLKQYRQQATSLVKAGSLYPCWCSSERLEDLRHQAQADRKPFKYDRRCLDQPGDPSQPHVLRFRVPDDIKEVIWTDLVKGEVSFKTADLDDFVALKSDGFPTYHLANVVDDHLMEISHVLRADEWLASTPKHLLLYEAFGWQPPEFAHLPAVLGSDGSKKLSKRAGAKEIMEYRDQGYLPAAVVNFLALLGWNPGEGSTQEIFSPDELIKSFSVERIQSSPAVFDAKRLDWMNGEYIRRLKLAELAKAAEPFWSPAAAKSDQDYKQQVLMLLQDRLKYLAELPELSEFFFDDPKPDFAASPLSAPERQRFIEAAAQALEKSSFKESDLEKTLRSLADQLGTKNGPLFGLLRLAITGQTAAPGLFETMAVLGQESVLRRLKQALQVT